jgi:tetratricopeptide (TPR) repeat protein
MSLNLEEKNRHIIPRWRDSVVTAAMGELDSLGTRHPHPIPLNELDFEDKVASWEEQRTISYASDLLATAAAGDVKHSVATDAAKFLLSCSAASAPAKAIARRYLGERELAAEVLERYYGSTHPFDPQIHHSRIRRLRKVLHESPRNVLARADLALEYTKVGLLRQALSSMHLALRLSPDSRFILRCAARLLVHVGDIEGALATLRASARTKLDPWLSAAEVAISGSAERPPRFAKTGAQLVRSQDHSPFQTTELASALATLEASAGAAKNARRLFAQSLVQPTENAVAQATWAAQKLRVPRWTPKTGH